MPSNKTYIIIGASAAGLTAAFTLRQLDATADIICISQEDEMPYNKCLLIGYLAQEKKEEQLFLASHELLDASSIQLILGTHVTAINPETQSIVVTSNKTLRYDALLIATGASPRIPPVLSRSDLTNIFPVHSLAHTHKIMQHMTEQSAGSALIIGAGLTGLEFADACIKRNIRPIVVDCGDRCLPKITNPQGAARVQAILETQGVQCHFSSTVTEILESNGRAIGIQLSSGTQLFADMIIVAAGVQPNSYLAQQAGAEVRQGGIVTDSFMKTTIPTIYAGGDVALVRDQLSGELIPTSLWPEARAQGKAAAYAMAGLDTQPYPGVLRVTKTSLGGVPIASCGPVATWDGEVIIKKDGAAYAAYLMESTRLRGFFMVGGTRNPRELGTIILDGGQFEP